MSAKVKVRSAWSNPVKLNFPVTEPSGQDPVNDDETCTRRELFAGIWTLKIWIFVCPAVLSSERVHVIALALLLRTNTLALRIQVSAFPGPLATRSTAVAVVLPAGTGSSVTVTGGATAHAGAAASTSVTSAIAMIVPARSRVEVIGVMSTPSVDLSTIHPPGPLLNDP